MARKKVKYPKAHRPKKTSDEQKELTIYLEDDGMELFLDALNQMPKNPKKEGREGPKTKPAKAPPKIHEEIDLHGLTLDQACRELDVTVERLFQLYPKTTIHLKVITGKGRHSGPEGPVLAGGVHGYLQRTFRRSIKEIQESPEEVQVGGMPIRGHFMVVFKPTGQG